MAHQCDKCNGRCCRYVAVEIDKPASAKDFDDMRWFTAHRGVTVFMARNRWYIHFHARCNYLTHEHRCEVYARRPRMCRGHQLADCEGPTQAYDFQLELRTPRQVEEYFEQVVQPKLAARRKRRRSGCKR
jgi:Fe-S-cluster containining protein